MSLAQMRYGSPEVPYNYLKTTPVPWCREGGSDSGMTLIIHTLLKTIDAIPVKTQHTRFLSTLQVPERLRWRARSAWSFSAISYSLANVASPLPHTYTIVCSEKSHENILCGLRQRLFRMVPVHEGLKRIGVAFGRFDPPRPLARTVSRSRTSK